MRVVRGGRASGVLLAAAALCASVLGAACPGVFQPGEIFDVGPNRGMCVVGDLDGDGNLDLTTGERAMLGDGAGGFTRSLALTDGGGVAVFDALIEDFDRDGRPDVAFVDIGMPRVGVLFGRGRDAPGGDVFEAPVFVPCVQCPWHLACGDVDGNGTRDIVVGSMSFPVISILLNNGDRTFEGRAHEGMPTETHALALGDFDGDGRLDIASGVRGYVSLLFGNGDGSFGGLVVSEGLFQGSFVFVHRFRAADFDGDGRADLVACADRGLSVYPGARIDRGAGLVPESAVELPIEGNGRFVELADMNCDGMLDIAALSETVVTTLRVFCAEAPTVEAPVAFAQGAPFSPTFTQTMAVPSLGDMNGDGAIDVVLVNEATNEGQILFGAEACELTAPGDANGDGRINIADAIAILSHLFGHVPARCPDALEVNGDRAVNIADAVYVLASLFAGGPPPVGAPRLCRGTR